MVKKENNENNNDIFPKIIALLVKPLTLVSPKIRIQYIENKPIKIDVILITLKKSLEESSISRKVKYTGITKRNLT